MSRMGAAIWRGQAPTLSHPCPPLVIRAHASPVSHLLPPLLLLLPLTPPSLKAVLIGRAVCRMRACACPRGAHPAADTGGLRSGRGARGGEGGGGTENSRASEGGGGRVKWGGGGELGRP